MEIPPAAVGSGYHALVITPVGPQDLTGGYVRKTSSRAIFPSFAEIALGTAFKCQVKTGSVTETSKFPINVTLYGEGDQELYQKSSGTTIKLKAPCDWLGVWNTQSVQNSRKCSGNFSIDYYNITMDHAINQSLCSPISFQGDLVSWTDDAQVTSKIKWKVTKSVWNVAPKDTVICTTMVSGNNKKVYIYTDPANQTFCPEGPGGGVTELSVELKQTGQECGANQNLIDPKDTCWGTFNTKTREFVCGGYYERTEVDPAGFRSWSEDSGRRSFVFRGRIQECDPDLIYGLWYMELPPPPVFIPKQKSLWEKYAAIIIPVSIIFLILMAGLCYALSRLIRYRRKYKEEKKETENLKDQAAEMAENFGGLGVYDEEVQMVANPLVLKFNQQKKELDELENRLKMRERTDEAEMEQLEKERSLILQEMERLKKALDNQKASKTASTSYDHDDHGSAPSTNYSAPAQSSFAQSQAPAQDYSQPEQQSGGWSAGPSPDTTSYASPKGPAAKPKKKDF